MKDYEIYCEFTNNDEELYTLVLDEEINFILKLPLNFNYTKNQIINICKSSLMKNNDRFKIYDVKYNCKVICNNLTNEIEQIITYLSENIYDLHENKVVV